METVEVEVRHHEAEGRYEALVDGLVVGITEHREDRPGVWTFPHTFVDPARRGQGVAERLVAAAMADVRTRGVKVNPTCWYVDQWLDTHREHADLRA